ncbi:MAG: PAS domain S-box protein, partial [Solirubrobacteraceae bacterium]
VATPDIAAGLRPHSGCSLTFAGAGGFASGHLDLISPHGAVGCTSLAAGTLGAPYATAPWLPSALRRPLVRGPVPDVRTGARALLVSAPIHGGGIAAVFLAMDGLGPGLASLYGGPTHLGFLVTDGDASTVLARSADPGRWVGTSLRSTPFDRTTSLLDRPDVNGVATIFARRSVLGLGWEVFAGANRATALASATRLRNTEDAILVIGLVAALAATLVISRRVTGPITLLSRSVERAAGADTPSTVPVVGPAEVAALGVGVNRLIGSVQRELGDRRRAEEDALASEQAYRTIFEANPQPMWVHDRESLAILEVNEATVTQYGYSRDELCAMGADQLGAAGGGAHLAHATGDPATARTARVQHRRRDGTVIEV